MDKWTVVRYLHLIGLVFFVGGQTMLAAAISPAIHKHGGAEVMRTIARRFGIGSIVALIVLVVTGAMMASRFELWDSSALQVKLMLLVLVGVLTGMHIASPTSRPLRLALPVLSLIILWLGVKMTHG